MAVLALALVSAFLVIVFPLRTLRRRRLAGDAGRASYRGGRPTRWVIADALFLAGFALVVAGPASQAVGADDALFRVGVAARTVAIAALVLATALAVWAQETMGRAWRPDIAPAGGCRLVTGGPFRIVRNPSYVAMLTASAATFVLASSAWGAAGCAVLLVSLQLTARAEEPGLRAAYGEEYLEYESRVGRFVPGPGRLKQR